MNAINTNASAQVPDTWPDNGIAFNLWYKDAAAFVSLIQATPQMCFFDMDLKYTKIHIDTRDGAFIIQDRDGNRVKAERVLSAIKKAQAQFTPKERSE